MYSDHLDAVPYVNTYLFYTIVSGNKYKAKGMTRFSVTPLLLVIYTVGKQETRNVIIDFEDPLRHRNEFFFQLFSVLPKRNNMEERCRDKSCHEEIDI